VVPIGLLLVQDLRRLEDIPEAERDGIDAAPEKRELVPYLLAYKTPLCGPCETNALSQGGSYSKGGLICQIYRTSLVSTDPPIRRVNSS